MKKRIWIVVALVGFLAGASFIASHVYVHQVGERKLTALLNGDQTVDILSFETDNQQRRLLCTDKEVLGYLKDMFLKHPEMTNLPVWGASYVGHLKFAGGGRYDGYMSIGTNGFSVSISSQAAEEGFPTDSVLLRSPMPDKVRQVFEFLDEPYEKVAGMVLVMEEGKNPERRYDRSLDLR